MRNITITILSTIAALSVGWGLKAARGLAETQRVEPLRNVAGNLWAWTHSEWDESAMCLIADDPSLL